MNKALFYQMGSIPSFFVDCGMEFLFEKCNKGGPYDVIICLRDNFFENPCYGFC